MSVRFSTPEWMILHFKDGVIGLFHTDEIGVIVVIVDDEEPVVVSDVSCVPESDPICWVRFIAINVDFELYVDFEMKII